MACLRVLRVSRSMAPCEKPYAFSLLSQNRLKLHRGLLQLRRRIRPIDHIRQRNPEDVAELGDRRNDRQSRRRDPRRSQHALHPLLRRLAVHHARTHLADDARLGRVLERLCKTDAHPAHIAASPCRNRLCASFQLKPATPWRTRLASSVWYILAALTASTVSVISFPLASMNAPP